jgi:hypothetical protein
LALQPKGDNRWLHLLQPIVDDYNTKFVRFSKKFRRQDVNKLNVNQLLAERYNVKDWTPIANSAVISNFSKDMLQAIPFKFQVGARVLLSKSANYTTATDTFAKNSGDGSYTKQVFEVDQVFLKTNAKHYYSIVFKIRTLAGVPLEGMYYSTELVSANFPEAADAVDEDKEDRKKRAARAKRNRERQ